MSRRPDIDALRVVATYLVVLFHAAKVFDEAPFYHVKNTEPSVALGVFTGFVHQWHMPLFFALAGWSLAASLRKRRGAEVRRERRQRLLVPLVFGTVVICPLIRHMQLRHLDGVDEPFWSFLPTFFTDPDRITWSHLWFLAYLLTFTLLYLPLLVRVGRRPDVAARPIHIVAAIALLVVVQVALRRAWPGWQNLVWDWANFAYYSGFFLAGWALAAFPTVDRLVDALWARLGVIGLVAAGCMLPYGLGIWTDETLLGYVTFQALSTLAGAGIVAALFGLARRVVRRDGPVLRWLAESAFPVYVLHQLAVVTAAVHVIERPWPTAVKFLVVLIAASAATVAGASIVGRTRWLHPLFGLRATRQRIERGSVAAPA